MDNALVLLNILRLHFRIVLPGSAVITVTVLQAGRSGVWIPTG